MAKLDLLGMSVDELLKLRDRIGEVLGAKATDLKRQLSRLAPGILSEKPAGGRRGPKKGHRVAPKYRSPNGETWSGRGLRPRWLTAAVKSGHKADEFLIAKPKSGRKRKSA
jgi:DNA-binding protein H-NS